MAPMELVTVGDSAGVELGFSPSCVISSKLSLISKMGVVLITLAEGCFQVLNEIKDVIFLAQCLVNCTDAENTQC